LEVFCLPKFLLESLLLAGSLKGVAVRGDKSSAVSVTLTLNRAEQQSEPTHDSPPFCRVNGGMGKQNPSTRSVLLLGLFLTDKKLWGIARIVPGKYVTFSSHDEM
jgi:hypothetical protein